MENFDLSEIDVKTMQLVVDIAEAGSVSDAAFRLGISQSTASYRLDRLRSAIDDMVFLRGANGMEPTVRGAQIAETFADILAQLGALSDGKGFDPATATRDFVVASTAFEIETVLARLQRHLLQETPGCRLIVRPMQTRDLPDRLRDRYDLALLSEPPKSGALKQVLLLRDRLVTFYDPDMRDAPGTLDAFCAADHAVASLGGTARSGVDYQLRKLNRKRRIRLETSNLESLAPLMKGTPLITTIPSKLASGLMRDFAFVECPLDFPTIPFHAVWHQNKDAEAGNIWLRQTLIALARG